jgi:hypothetical protein
MEGLRMDALPALRIVDALGIYGESSDPVYPEKNLLPIWASRFDLHLEVLRPWPESAVAGQTDVVEILFAEPGGEFKQVDQRSLEGLITFPLKLELDNQHLVEGESRIFFRVRTHNQNVYESEPAAFTIDKRIPLDKRPPTPIVDEPLYDGPGVTEGYLKANCDVVKVRIPGYLGYKKGDRVSILFGPLNPPPVAEALIDVRASETVVALPRYVFESLKNGVYLLHYRLESRAGAQTELSTGKFIRVNFPPRESDT